MDGWMDHPWMDGLMDGLFSDPVLWSFSEQHSLNHTEYIFRYQFFLSVNSNRYRSRDGYDEPPKRQHHYYYYYYSILHHFATVSRLEIFCNHYYTPVKNQHHTKRIYSQ
mmetsp:Transcript_27171/g.63616  ORF Transcript_27171/g.63616 Transcript_27171/m.63616 type:complete len:109 (+) Transcript_27171:376-702(+)